MFNKLFTIRLLILFSLVISITVHAQPSGGSASPQRTIIEIGDGLYRVNTGPGVSGVFVFLVTDEGILIVDPSNPDVSEWLSGELNSRFPGQEVRYVVESHYHWDHARGASRFEDTALFIGHKNLLTNLDANIAEAPPPGNTRDENGDSLLARSEAQTGTLSNFDAMDLNADNILTQAELTTGIVRPDIVFSDRLELNFGGKRVTLIWSQNRHTNDLIDVYFPDHKVLYATDYVWINRMCCRFEFDGRPLSTWIESIRDLETLDFDILINSHFATGSKADLIGFRRQLEDFGYAVAEGIANGNSLEEIQSTLRLEEYSNLEGYDSQWDAIIASFYGSLMLE